MRLTDRRTFLTTSLLGAAGAGRLVATPGPAKALPTIRLADKMVTRLIAGGNPIAGYSHSSQRLSQLMLQYFNVERTTEFLLRCEAEGINTWQCSYQPVGRDALRAARERGSKIQYICLSADRAGLSFQDVLALKPIAICHHGSDTDRLMAAGQAQKIHDYIKRVHDAGLPAGVSTHSPDNLARLEDSDWKADFYMACFYNLSRPMEQTKSRLGDELLGEVYFASDPKRMTERVRQIGKTCLAFKILAAGRLCNSTASVERAFEFAYSNIKPTDGVIVGMFPILSDEVGEDAMLARKYAKVA
jgi:hypothetical protein